MLGQNEARASSKADDTGEYSFGSPLAESETSTPVPSISACCVKGGPETKPSIALREKAAMNSGGCIGVVVTSSRGTPAIFCTVFKTISGMAAAPPVAMVLPLRILPRSASEALESKCAASAISLRMTMYSSDSEIAVASAVSFCPRALARVIEGPDDIEKSTEPAITAFIEPMPWMC